jgi:hypothetical protein
MNLNLLLYQSCIFLWDGCLLDDCAFCLIIGLYDLVRPTPRFTRAGQVWVWSRGAVNYGADVVGGCKELSAGKGACLFLTNCRREFFIAADACKNTRNGVGCNSLLGRNAGRLLMQPRQILLCGCKYKI